MNALKARVGGTVLLLAAAVAALALFSTGPGGGGGTATHRARHVQLLASSVNQVPLYVQFEVTSDTRGVLEGNAPDGGYEKSPFSREYWLHPKEKLTIRFIVGVNDVGNVVSCFVQTENGTAAHDRHAKKRNTRGPVPLDTNCSTAVINL